MSRSIPGRLAAAAAAALFTGAAGAQAAGASGVTTGISGLAIDFSIQTRRDLCSARFPDTRPAWVERTAAWQQRNSAVLGDLKAEGDRLDPAARAAASGAPLPPADAPTTVLRQMRLMAGLAPATNLAPLADEQARWVCGQWLADLEPAGKAEQALPTLLDAARKLRAPAR
jgi:hypothetical protein